MKKFLFLVLVLAICAAAFFTRPQNPKASFTDYLVNKQAQKDTVIPAAWTSIVAKDFADQCEYKDHYLWVDVKYHDKTVYTGAFSHWFNRAELKHDFQKGVEKAKDKMDSAADHLAGKS